VDLDVVADADRLADAAGECEHEYPSMGVCVLPSLATPVGRAVVRVCGLTTVARPP
jgi:hypothetical protein